MKTRTLVAGIVALVAAGALGICGGLIGPDESPVKGHGPQYSSKTQVDPADFLKSLQGNPPKPLGLRGTEGDLLYVTSPRLLQSSTTPQATEKFAMAAIQVAHATWDQWFADQKAPGPSLEVMMLRRDTSVSEFTTQCITDDPSFDQTFHHDSPQVFYCPGDTGKAADPMDAVLTVPMSTMEDLAAVKFGNLRLLLMAAHALGHHAADGIARYLQVSPPKGEADVLLADCFAGTFLSLFAPAAANFASAKSLKPLMEALEPLFVGGAGFFAKRLTAFTTGFAGPHPAAPANCYGYWPGFPQTK